EEHKTVWLRQRLNRDQVWRNHQSVLTTDHWDCDSIENRHVSSSNSFFKDLSFLVFHKNRSVSRILTFQTVKETRRLPSLNKNFSFCRLILIKYITKIFIFYFFI